MRLLICAGGTGGGVYPALAVLQTLNQRAEPVLWVGNKAGMDADLVQRAGIPFKGIHAAGIHGVNLSALPGNVIQLIKGYIEARKILNEFQPDVILYTGGFVAVPVAMAGRKYPNLLYIPDIEPGLALKFLARFASCIAVTAEESLTFFRTTPKPVVTGYPIRPDLCHWERKAALEKLNLPVLLLFGGSKGAKSINDALIDILSTLVEKMQVIHITGENNWGEAKNHQAQLPPALANRYHAFPYLHEDMGAALASASLVISRAGASILGEFPHFGLPSILVPYPFAWRYQKINADYLANHGGAVIIENGELKEKLLPAILDIINNPARLEKMSLASKALDKPGAVTKLADMLEKLATKIPIVKGDYE